MVRGWLLVAVLLLGAGLVGSAPHKDREGGGEAEEEHAKDASFPDRAWIWIKQAWKTVKGLAVGEHSLYNQLMSKLKGNRTISMLGKKVTFTLPEPSSTSNVPWGGSFSSIIHNLKKEPLLRVLLALYINIVIFIAVYGYLIIRHIMMSVNLNKAAKPEKERERRRAAERKKMAKRLARENKRGGKNLEFSPHLSSEGGQDTIRSTDFEEETVLGSIYTAPNSPVRRPHLSLQSSVYTTPNQTTSQ